MVVLRKRRAARAPKIRQEMGDLDVVFGAIRPIGPAALGSIMVERLVAGARDSAANGTLSAIG
jgi:hypothetical protein